MKRLLILAFLITSCGLSRTEKERVHVLKDHIARNSEVYSHQLEHALEWKKLGNEKGYEDFLNEANIALYKLNQYRVEFAELCSGHESECKNY